MNESVIPSQRGRRAAVAAAGACLFAMRYLMVQAALSAAILAPLSVQAQAPAAAEMATGEVLKVDKAMKKITLKHGPIKSLDMPPMTMVFHAGDPAMVENVKAGDKVRFSASHEGGKYTVIELQPAK